MELESNGAENEEFSEKLRQSGLKLRETERSLQVSQRESQSYKDMLQQSQEQYSNLDMKYNKVFFFFPTQFALQLQKFSNMYTFRNII